MKKELTLSSDQEATIAQVLAHFGLTHEQAWWMMIDEGCRYLRAAIGSDYNTYLRFRNSPMFWRFYVRRWAEMEFTLHRQLKTLQGHPEIYQSMHRKAMRPNIPGDLQKSMLKQMHYENALNST